MARFSDWDPYNEYVQNGTVDGLFMNASFTLLAAGPPRLANVGKNVFEGEVGETLNELVFPLGVVQNFNLSHNRQFNRIWEIGSERSFFISGRTIGQVGLSRVMYHGPSLLRVLYAYYQDIVGPTYVTSLFSGINPASLFLANSHNIQIPPGYKNMYLNLASDLFTQPLGLMTYWRNSNDEPVCGTYLEACYVPNHTIATDAQGTIVQENVALQFERAVPVAIAAIDTYDVDGEPIEIGGLAA